MRGLELRLGELSVTGRDQTWLPTLVGRESASSKLVRGLQELDTSGCRLLSPVSPQAQASTPTSAPGSSRGLRTISRFGARANERAAEAEGDLGAHDAEERLDGAFETGASHASNAHGTRDRRGEDGTKAFEHLVESINAALSGGDWLAPIRALRRDEVITETLPARGVRHYKIALPSRPTAVTVTVTRTAGMSPALWGSTGCERPTARNHDMRSSHDRLVYEHALIGDDVDETAGIDRRKTVPPCRELYVTAEAEAGECSYKLQVSFGQIKIVLSRAEIASQIQKIRRGWEAKVSALQQEPAQRERFEERVKNLTEERRKKTMVSHRGVNFLERNMRNVPEASPRQALVRLEKKALLGFAKHDEVSARREFLEEEVDRSNRQWLNRSQERRLVRLDAQRQLEEERRTEDVRRSWLIRLAIVSFAVNFGRTFTLLREKLQYTHRIIVSACVLQRFMIRSLCKKRRLKLYSNIAKLRIAMASYARSVRPAIMCASTPVIRGFLHEYAFSKESPSLGGALKHFRCTVVIIQHWWQRVRNSRRAYVELFLPHWEAVQAKIQRDHPRGFHPLDPRKGRDSGRSHLDAPSRSSEDQPRRLHSKHSAHHGHGALTHRATVATLGSEDDRAFHQRESNMDMPPYIARMALSKYIGEMQRSHPRRVREWEEGRKKAQWAKDLEGFGVHEQAPQGADAVAAAALAACPRPRAVYVNRDELAEIVRGNLDKWRKGGFRELRHYRRKVLGTAFHMWAGTALHLPSSKTIVAAATLRREKTFLASLLSSKTDRQRTVKIADEQAWEEVDAGSEPEEEAREETP